ncbi:MAG: 3'-5' exonuclease, partial [Clostridia bacterium]|nr:3'-5' exonuclease [Clostridia bacterium]
PENFVPVEREKRKVANNYSFVSPKPVELEEQDNFLIDKSAPECFKGRTFVVFDLETTGTDFDDKITEIGAVKIVDGKFTERFTTLINPGKHIPKDVAELTGIDDDTVKDALSYEKVCADFYKFCYGATLIGHNVEFDIRFVRNQSKPLDYIFDNPLMDTLAIAREVVYGVANYKLNTLCEKFGIKFRHHRAYSDAFATAELFIELIRIRKSLPF